MNHSLVKLCLALLMAGWLQTSPVHADIYSWTDANGILHFSNDPPPAGVTANQQKEIRHDAAQHTKWQEARRIEQEKILQESRSNAGVQKKAVLAPGPETRKPGKVVMFTTPTCGYCVRAKKFFNKHNIGFTEYDITASRKARQLYQQHNGSGVPLILVDNQRIAGFNKPLLRRLFGIASAKARP